MGVRIAVVTVSDSASNGARTVDVSGDTAQQMLEGAGFTVAVREVVPDERFVIAQTLRRLCALEDISCVITTGGTGIGPRDVTPEATLDVIDKSLPGIAEAMRAESLKKTPFAMLSRQVAGVCNRTLIVNLPGSPKAVAECLDVVLPVLRHAVQLMAGNTSHRETP
ncbi:molybdenum cofactor biosynthesis protein B [Alicyclobacillus pomorum]|uniref:MogA/MoaB family molybdenum cofactor biosynthesis protein n=1 Tax=Alicyclobacillus pomorum TaxID=204470 RepID=UPI0003F62E36|nr:MogA/MoaB family molybdenum cofactor biosynthesis protein [Alicyclobacillus pomorum]